MTNAISSIALLTSTRDDQIYDHIETINGLGGDVMFITRLHPGYLVGKYDMEDAECLWLSGRPGKGAVSPKSMGNIIRSVKGALCSLESPVIVFDGLEYLLLWNDVSKVMSMLNDLDRIISNMGGRVIVSIDPDTFEDGDLRMIETSYPPVAIEDLQAIRESQHTAKPMPGCESRKTLGLLVRA